MIELPVEAKKPTDIAPEEKVTGSAIYRMVSPEDRKILKEIAKKKAREMGLVINIIEK